MRREVDEEILDIIPERLVDRLDRMGGAGRRFRQGLTLLLGATAIAAAVAGWYIFMGGTSGPVSEADVPVISADARPLKARPENPGGMVVPNQDKLIYEGLGRGERDTAVERLLPPPEQPKAPPVQSPPVREEAATAPPSSASAPPSPPAVSAMPVAPVAVPPPAPPPASATAKSAPAVETLPSAAAARQGAARGEFMIQLAAMGTMDAAQKEWVRLKKASPDLLAAQASDIVKVDLGAKGVFFRLRAGPMDELSARTLCGQMTKRNAGCMVVRK